MIDLLYNVFYYAEDLKSIHVHTCLNSFPSKYMRRSIKQSLHFMRINHTKPKRNAHSCHYGTGRHGAKRDDHDETTIEDGQRRAKRRTRSIEGAGGADRSLDSVEDKRRMTISQTGVLDNPPVRCK